MMTLNNIDYRLIDLLQTNARATQSELAAEVGLSQPAVAERIKKLEQEGVITGYVARVNARLLDKDIVAFIGVAINHPKYNAGFARKILSVPDVLECHHVTGQDSYLLKVVTESTESLDALISEHIRTIAGVTRTHTTIVMSTVKEVSHIIPSPAEAGAKKTRRQKPRE